MIESLSQADTVNGISHLTDKRHGQRVSKRINEKTAGLSGVVSDMVKEAEEAGIDVITDLVNQIIAYRLLQRNGNSALS